MTMQFITSDIVVAAGAALDLGTTDSVYVGRNVLIASPDYVAVWGTGAGQSVTVYGSVAGDYGVYIGAQITNDTHGSVFIGAGADVFGAISGVSTGG